MVKEFWHGGFGIFSPIIQGLYQSPPKYLFPNPIYNNFGKTGIVRRGYPLGILIN